MRECSAVTPPSVSSPGTVCGNWAWSCSSDDERYASNTVTAVKMPEGIDGRALMGRLRTEKNVVLAGGQGKLSSSIFRIGHLGHVSPRMTSRK